MNGRCFDVVCSPEASEGAQTGTLKGAGKRSERCIGAANHASGGVRRGNQRRQPPCRGAEPRLRRLPTLISPPDAIKTPSIYGFTS